MHVRDIVSGRVEVIHPDTLLKDAAKLMRGCQTGLISVCAETLCIN